MNDATPFGCPRIEDISALLDGMLTGRAAGEIRAHAGQCPLCAARLADFSAMSTRLQTLRDFRCDVDLAALVGPRLPARAPVRRKRPRRNWRDLWQLVPSGVAAAAALAAGAYLGVLLVAGAGTALRPAAMTVFDGVPPGSLCSGLPSCSPRGR